MREYETTFIIQPEISDEGIAQLQGRLDALLEREKAARLLYEDLGRRKLAYEIRRFQKGHYWTLFFLDDGGVVPELERLLRLEDSVLRYLTVLANDEVADVEARKAEAAEQERIRVQKAAERAAREAEEVAAAAAAAAEREAEREAAGPASEEAGAEDAPTAEGARAVEDAPTAEGARAVEDAPTAEDAPGDEDDDGSDPEPERED